MSAEPGAQAGGLGPACFGRSSARWIQHNWLAVRTWSVGGTDAGVSRLHVVTSMSSGQSAWTNVSGVPQSGQKRRVPHALDANALGVPRVSRKPARFTEKHATNGAADAFRQSAQWQIVEWNGWPVIS